MEPEEVELVVRQLDALVGELQELNATLHDLAAVIVRELGAIKVVAVSARSSAILLTPVGES